MLRWISLLPLWGSKTPSAPARQIGTVHDLIIVPHRTAARLVPIALDRCPADRDVQGLQRPHDLGRPPGPVLSGHLADQRPRVFRDAGPARRSPAPSGPAAAPRDAMPAHHRRGLHDQDVGPPGTLALGDGRPETASRDCQPWTPIRPLMDQQLLPQDEVLQDQVLTGSAGQPQRQEEQSEIQPHQTTLQRRRVAHVGGSAKNRSRSGFGPSQRRERPTRG